MADLLESLRATGDEILEAALPTPAELPKVIAALVAHLEQHIAGLDAIDLAQVPGRIVPEATPVTSEAAAADETAEASELAALREANAQLQAQLSAAQAAAPAVTSEPAPPTP